MANYVKFWPILVDFTMTSHLLFSNHVTMFANFEKFLISPGFLLNFRQGHQISKIKLKSSEIYGEKTEGVPKDPLDRIGLKVRGTFKDPPPL